ncbi:MAG: PVC-type heme-binding CxxCH protein, partial [Planctomycetota bacterium]
MCSLIASHPTWAQEANSWGSTEETQFTPNIHHPNIKGVTLFAQNPEIVTPVGIAVAPDGRVFVQENHTHKRDSGYRGPKTDRILVFEDQDKDGVAETRSIFYEGHTFSTDLLFGPDGHLYVSTRWFIARFLNAATQQKAESEPEKIVVCDTDGDYPHNGVGGLAIDPANPDWLAFGFGENLGQKYTFVGSDGVKLSGGAEGGSTYRCRTDGSELTRQSTGHWNAFGMAFDLRGNLFSTDNDPNAVPPNRLLHVVPGADFGFEYRYGRSGLHPLVCWYGENPGTLGMIGALGEAACGLTSNGPGRLLSASWTDNRVDLHSLQPNGDSFTATREPFLSGPDDFRPVHFAYSPDGRYLYFTDWVKLSYPVHGHGRIWRVEFKEPISLEPIQDRPPAAELSAENALAKLGSTDPYARTAAMHVLARHADALNDYDWQSDSSAVARAHYAVAMKRSESDQRRSIIPTLLEDSDPEVRFVGIKWIADEGLSQYERSLQSVLDRDDLSRRDLLAVVAALQRISSDSKKEFTPDDTLLDLALDANKPPSLRAMAIASVKVDHPRLTADALRSLVRTDDLRLRREAVHSLAIDPDSRKAAVLAEIAGDGALDPDLRADAIAGLSAVASEYADLLVKLSNDTNPIISSEAKRTRFASGLSERDVESKPSPDQIDEWIDLVNREVTEAPSAAIGRRLFFHSHLAGCYKCHAMHGRGNSIGPDLTNIRNQTGATQAWLLEHIVNPNAEMAPYYRPQQILTIDGEILVGLII